MEQEETEQDTIYIEDGEEEINLRFWGFLHTIFNDDSLLNKKGIKVKQEIEEESGEVSREQRQKALELFYNY